MAGEELELQLAPQVSRMNASAQTAMPGDEREGRDAVHTALHLRTVRKLDTLLLPFLALLFLFNALDKSNVGNAESAHFTTDIGLEKGDLNTSVVLFFAFFVSLQPVGAALGRRYGMVRWVPTCMLIWGIATALHVWVKYRWQLFTLRIIIGCMEAGFYPVTVTYLSLFYTRFEFGRRLSLFYGQAAVGGALGGLISYIVFSRFQHEDSDGKIKTKWRPWQALFLFEGALTIIVACIGYFWLPHSVETAWFLSPQEREYASSRIIRDRSLQASPAIREDEENNDERESDEESHGLLRSSKPTAPLLDRNSLDDRGLTPRDILSAVFNTKIWHILFCNILSAVPVYAFSVFLPLVLAPLTRTPNPALVNLLTAPPHVCGAVTLYFFAQYSDRHRIRLYPIFYGLVITVVGLTLVVILPTAWAVPRYLSLNVLLSGTYIASPLTVAWISGNTPAPGKRALLLGINGWGNLAGIISAILFRPKYAASGYIVPFWWTLICVALSAVGYVLFWRRLIQENATRVLTLRGWSDENVEREVKEGRGSLPQTARWLKLGITLARRSQWTTWLADWLEEAVRVGRQGDERMTFMYGL